MDFEWDTGNLGEIGNHDVSPSEVESVILNPLSEKSGVYERNGEPRAPVIGPSNEDRILVVLYTIRRGRIRVVTAYPASLRAVWQYRERYP